MSVSPPLLLAAAGYTLGTLAAFGVSTRWSLFGYHESLWGSWQEAAGATEIAAALLLGWELARMRILARRPCVGYVEAAPASRV